MFPGARRSSRVCLLEEGEEHSWCVQVTEVGGSGTSTGRAVERPECRLCRVSCGEEPEVAIER